MLLRKSLGTENTFTVFVLKNLCIRGQTQFKTVWFKGQLYTHTSVLTSIYRYIHVCTYVYIYTCISWLYPTRRPRSNDIIGVEITTIQILVYTYHYSLKPNQPTRAPQRKGWFQASAGKYKMSLERIVVHLPHPETKGST